MAVGTCRSTPSRAFVSPNALRTPDTSIIGSATVGSLISPFYRLVPEALVPLLPRDPSPSRIDRAVTVGAWGTSTWPRPTAC